MRVYDGMSNISKSSCKGKCLNFKAKKHTNGGWYASGIFRCNICDIFVTSEGVRDGRFCSCCNIRVRTRPRNGACKEKYFERVKNQIKSDNDPNSIEKKYTTETNSSINLEDDEMNDTKKSTPFYEEIDESVKTYYELKEFLESTIKPKTNYPYVVLKELLEYGKLHKGDIAESLAYFNNKDTTNLETVKYYLNVPVYDVLLKHELVILDGEYYGLPYFTLNVKLTDFQRIELIDYFTNTIVQYNEEHDIPENHFPNSNNMGNIEWSDVNIKNSSNVQKLKNLVKKIRPASTNSWIWSVTPENWEIVKSKYVYGSRIPKERISSKVQSGDQVAFYVIGTNSFKGIFEFDGNWFDSPGKLWDDDLELDGSLRYSSRINLKPIQLGSVNVLDLYEKMELFIGKSHNSCNLLLRGNNGYPSNNSKSLLESDFEIIEQHLAQNSIISEPKVEGTDTKIVKECPKCHETRVEEIHGIGLDNKIEEYFGYRQFDPSNPQSRKPQSYCRKCRNSKKESSHVRKKISFQISEDKPKIEEKSDTKISLERFLEFKHIENGVAIKQYFDSNRCCGTRN